MYIYNSSLNVVFVYSSPITVYSNHRSDLPMTAIDHYSLDQSGLIKMIWIS